MSLAHGTMPSILLVEDDPISALFLSAALEDLPANVQVAADCAQARAASGPFDAWLIDANLPDGTGAALLQRLRQGLTLIGVTGAEQDAGIKVLTDTLAEAFLSKTASIPQAHIEAMSKRLANLEDFINDATLGDMPLNSESIEMMLGMCHVHDFVMQYGSFV